MAFSEAFDDTPLPTKRGIKRNKLLKNQRQRHIMAEHKEGVRTAAWLVDPVRDSVVEA